MTALRGLNNRYNAFLFRDTLLQMIQGEALPYADLVAEEAYLALGSDPGLPLPVGATY